MAKANVNDRASLERAYPRDAFAEDSARNVATSDLLRRGVRIDSAPDAEGRFELERVKRHAGEPETPYFLAPLHSAEELSESGPHGGARQASPPRPRIGYEQFLDDIVAAARRF